MGLFEEFEIYYAHCSDYKAAVFHKATTELGAGRWVQDK